MAFGGGAGLPSPPPHRDQRMNKWEQFARENAEFYILTNPHVDYSSTEGQGYFFRSGEEFTVRSLARADSYIRERNRGLEIGCGIGRLAFPHASRFHELYAVDISETMLNRLHEIAGQRGVYNIRPFLPEQKWDEPESINYAYSFLVFQHIEDLGTIESYIRRIARALKPGAIAQLQFDTRPPIFLYRIRNIMPDVLLPRPYRKGIRRIRRDPVELGILFRENGLFILEEYNRDTENHIFLLRRT